MPGDFRCDWRRRKWRRAWYRLGESRLYVRERVLQRNIAGKCATIIWRDSGKAPVAAAALKVTATDLLQLKIIDGIVPEPIGGAQDDPEASAYALKDMLKMALAELSPLTRQQLIDDRCDKFRRMGNFFHEATL